ncbi:hypothetical protein DPMN_060239 [Dreissena polymorpha]|uniref:Uncharacterized protein n=1 Tax=Dreissena polymorpha TaxID=45954 RepID=A0A9D4C5F6_DREPO|nr:hypothetical protein DPMN_060239 [Dreissena polymorpha]
MVGEVSGMQRQSCGTRCLTNSDKQAPSANLKPLSQVGMERYVTAQGAIRLSCSYLRSNLSGSESADWDC